MWPPVLEDRLSTTLSPRLSETQADMRQLERPVVVPLGSISGVPGSNEQNPARSVDE